MYISGKFVEVMRQKRGIESQSALARRAQIDHASLNKWENGRKLPGDAIIRRVARALDIDAEDMLALTDSEREGERAARHIALAQRSALDSERVEEIMDKYGVVLPGSEGNTPVRLPCIREQHPLYTGSAMTCIASRVPVPVVGHVPACEPWPAPDEKDAVEHVLVDEELISDAGYAFGLVVTGPSMTGYGVEHGYVVVIDKMAHWRTGDVVAVHADGKYTLKRLVSVRGNLVLQGLGPEEADYLYNEDSDAVEIVGVVVYKRRKPAND